MESLHVVVMDTKEHDSGVAVIGMVNVTNNESNAHYSFNSSIEAFKCLPKPTNGSYNGTEKFW